jgi:PAS domain-containing protein
MNKEYYKPLIIFFMLAFCGLIYYFGELIDWAAWNAIRNDFFYGIHDIHRLLFLAPIIYAGYVARVKGAIIITLISFIIFLPRAFFISPFPDPLLRMVLFVIFAGVIGALVGVIRNQSEASIRKEAVITVERNRFKDIIDGLADGIIITDRDYKIRYMNDRLVEVFGDGTGSTCYQHLHQATTPCQEDCRLFNVIEQGIIQKWHCRFPNYKSYEVIAAPFIDHDGTSCQISIFRDIRND